jgi:hypothetical protein
MVSLFAEACEETIGTFQYAITIRLVLMAENSRTIAARLIIAATLEYCYCLLLSMPIPFSQTPGVILEKTNPATGAGLLEKQMKQANAK